MDSSQGREIERSELSAVESGMKHFHRVVSLTLLVLASLRLLVEVFRPGSAQARLVLACAPAAFCALIQRRSAHLLQNSKIKSSMRRSFLVGNPAFPAELNPWRR